MKPKWKLNGMANRLMYKLVQDLNQISPDLISKTRKSKKPDNDPNIMDYHDGIVLCVTQAKQAPVKYGYVYRHYRDKIVRNARKRCSSKQYVDFLMSDIDTRIETTYEMLKYVRIDTTQPAPIDLSVEPDQVAYQIQQYVYLNIDAIKPIYLDITPTKAVAGYVSSDENGWLRFLLGEVNESDPEKIRVYGTVDTPTDYIQCEFEILF